MKGRIIKYFSRRGFGFISPENSEDEIFFHVSNFPVEVQPEIGKDVGFELIDTPKGKEAKNIQILSDVPTEEPVEAESLDTVSPEAESMKVREIKGVGKATEEKLKNSGFDSVASIASVDADTVSEKTGISSKVAAKLVASAKELLE